MTTPLLGHVSDSGTVWGNPPDHPYYWTDGSALLIDALGAVIIDAPGNDALIRPLRQFPRNYEALIDFELNDLSAEFEIDIYGRIVHDSGPDNSTTTAVDSYFYYDGSGSWPAEDGSTVTMTTGTHQMKVQVHEEVMGVWVDDQLFAWQDFRTGTQTINGSDIVLYFWVSNATTPSAIRILKMAVNERTADPDLHKVSFVGGSDQINAIGNFVVAPHKFDILTTWVGPTTEWSVTGGGTIDSTGLYTPPTTAGYYRPTVTAVVTSEGSTISTKTFWFNVLVPGTRTLLSDTFAGAAGSIASRLPETYNDHSTYDGLWVKFNTVADTDLDGAGNLVSVNDGNSFDIPDNTGLIYILSADPNTGFTPNGGLSWAVSSGGWQEATMVATINHGALANGTWPSNLEYTFARFGFQNNYNSAGSFNVFLTRDATTHNVKAAITVECWNTPALVTNDMLNVFAFTPGVDYSLKIQVVATGTTTIYKVFFNDVLYSQTTLKTRRVGDVDNLRVALAGSSVPLNLKVKDISVQGTIRGPSSLINTIDDIFIGNDSNVFDTASQKLNGFHDTTGLVPLTNYNYITPGTINDPLPGNYTFTFIPGTLPVSAMYVEIWDTAHGLGALLGTNLVGGSLTSTVTWVTTESVNPYALMYPQGNTKGTFQIRFDRT